MTQLILDTEGYDIALPESRKGGYHAEKQPLSVDVEMVSGRIVRELRGNVWYITYQYGYFDDAMKNNVIAACEKGRRQAIICGFLPPNPTISPTACRPAGLIWKISSSHAAPRTRVRIT